MSGRKAESPSQEGLSQQLLRIPLGSLAIGVSLWLISVVALLGVLTLLVLRPSLEFTSDSSEPLVSAKAENQVGPEGVVCSFPNLEN